MKRLVTGKSALATAVGALLGGLVAGPWGIALGAAGGAAISVAPRRHKSAMTPARAIEYEKAITTIKDPTELRLKADEFAQDGHEEQARCLRARAASRDLPVDVKQQRQRIFRDAFSSDDPKYIEGLADVYETQCMFLGAKKLRSHAAAVRAADEAKATGKAAPSADVDALRNSLVEIIRQFGADSEQAKMAAATYLRAAHGSEPDEAAVHAEIVAATPPGATPPAPAAASAPAHEVAAP